MCYPNKNLIIIISCVLALFSFKAFGSDIDLFSMSLRELMTVRIASSSAFSDEPLDAAATVSVVSRDEWEKWGAKNLYESVTHLPGVVTMPTYVASDVPKIRGYATALPRGLATVIDGISVNDYAFKTSSYTLSLMGLKVLNKIELVRGPGSVGYGTDAFHGVMSLQSFESDKNYNELDVNVDSNDYLSLSLLDSIHSGNWHINTAIQSSSRNGGEQNYSYTDPDTLQEQQSQWDRDYDRLTTIAKVYYDSDVSDNGYYINAYHVSGEIDDGYGLGRRPSTLTSHLKENDSYSNDTRFNMLKVGAEGKVFNPDIDYQITAALWETQRVSERYTSYTSNNIGRVDSVAHSFSATITSEPANKNLHWAASSGRQKDKVDRLDNKSINESTGSVTETTSKSEGFTESIDYLTLQLKQRLLNKKLMLQFGIRYDYYDSFGGQVSPRLGIIVRPTNEDSYKLLYGKAFRSPSSVEQAGTSTIRSNDNLEPETIDTFEAVYMHYEEQWRIELVAFYSQWKDGIITVASSDPNFSTEYTNVADSDSKGVEASFSLELNTWKFDTSASYTTSENNETDVKYVAFPEWGISIGIGKDFSQHTSIYLANRILLSMKENPDPNSKDLPTSWQAHLTLEHQYNNNLSFVVRANNLFDRDNTRSAMLYQENGIPGEDRIFEAAVKFNF